MNDLNLMLDNIEAQLGTYSNKTEIYNNNNLNFPLKNKYNLYLGNLDYSFINNPNNNYKIDSRLTYNNFGTTKLEEQSSINQFDQVSNGGMEYKLSLPYYQKTKIHNSIKKELKPYSNNIQNDIKTNINNIKTDLENLKKKENNIDKIRNDLQDINKKLLDYENSFALIEKDNQRTTTLLQNTSSENSKKDENIIGKYIELEQKFEELQNKISVIKDAQNKTDYQIKNSIIENNDYQDIISNLEQQINNFKENTENETNIKLAQLTNNFNEKYNYHNEQIEKLNSKTNQIHGTLNVINETLEVKSEIPEIKNKMDDLNNEINNLKNKLSEISKTQFNINNNNENSSFKDLENNFNQISQQINEQQLNIDLIKKNYVDKDNLDDINNRLLVIQNDINILMEKNENDKESIHSANENLIKLNKENNNNNMVTRDEFKDIINKNENEYIKLQTDLNNKINDIVNNYQILENKYNEFNEQDIINAQTYYSEIFKKMAQEINKNKKDLQDLNDQNDKNYKIFEQINRNFKLIDSEIIKISNIEKNENKNKSKIEEIDKKLTNFENILNENKEQMKNLQRDSLDMLNNEKEGNNKEQKYKKMLEGEESNNSNLQLQIDELNEKEKTNIQNLENKLNEFRQQQTEINQQNNLKIIELNNKINKNKNEDDLMLSQSEVINGNKSNNNSNNYEEKINDLEKKIDLLKEACEKIDKLNDKNQNDINEKFEDISNWLTNFKENINNNLKNLKLYVDKKIENLGNSKTSINNK